MSDLPVLEAPKPVKPVEKKQASAMIPMAEEKKSALDGKVLEFVNTVLSSDLHSVEFKEKVQAVHSMGNDKIREAASMSNRMLDRPVKAMNNGVMDENSPVAKSLLELRQTVEGLDPSTQGDLSAPRKLLGFIPFGNKMRDYFMKFQSGQSHINAIIEALNNGRDELEKDNVAIESEKVRMWEVMAMLKQYIYVSEEIDRALVDKVSKIKAQDPDKAKVVEEEVLFYLRQKQIDITTQQSVNIQGYLALDLIRKNNLELIKGVERATTTTVSALRTAVMVAQALANQRLVLDQINALNTTTSNMIAGTAKLLKQQSAQIHEQAASSTIDMSKLQESFADIYETFDMVSNFKTQALENMSQTVTALKGEIEKSETYLDRVRSETVAEQTDGLLTEKESEEVAI